MNPTPVRGLLIEDSSEDVALFQRMLARAGDSVFSFECADRLSTGLRRLADGGIDVVLLDLSLPDGQGLDTFTQTRAKAPRVPIVVLTGLDDRALATSVLRQGAQDYLVKGRVDSNMLERSIRYAIERARAEEALLESNARYHVVTEAASDAIITLDEKGRINLINRAAESIFGYKAEEMLGQPLHFLLPEELLTGQQPAFPSSLGTDVVPLTGRSLEFRGRHKTGREIPVEISFGEFIKNDQFIVTGIIRDITERKRAQDALRASEERYRQLFDNAHEIVYAHDLQGNFSSLNKAGERTTGYTRDEFIKLNLHQVVAPEHLELALRQVDGRLFGVTEPSVYELDLIAKDGHRIQVEVSTQLIYQDGETVGVQGFCRDVTDRRHLESQLRQAQKMETIGRLAGGVAHDFNNLLTAILGYSDLLIDQLGAQHPLSRDVDEIKKAAERAAALTRQLLAFSRRQLLAPTVLDLNALVTDMDKMLRRLIGADIDLVTLTDPALGRVRADPGQIEQLVMNLAVNARDAMPRGGKLTIETASIVLDHTYARDHVQVEPGRYVMLAVSDTGCGMSEDTRSHIFEPFFTTKEFGKGTGLGLATVYGIVKQSGGHIGVYSQPGHGATFKIYLPETGETADADEPLRTAMRQVRGSETILLVEDDEGVRSMTRQVLEANGYTVLAAPLATEAFQLCEKHNGPIHLVVSDVLMPHICGPEMIQRLAIQRPALKTLFISGFPDRAIIRHGVLEAGSQFLQKPFTLASLLTKVREVLDEDNGHAR